MKHKLVPGVKLRLKSDTIPSKFECQKAEVKECVPKPAYVKRRRLELLEDNHSEEVATSSNNDLEFIDCGTGHIKETAELDPIAIELPKTAGGFIIH